MGIVLVKLLRLKFARVALVVAGIGPCLSAQPVPRLEAQGWIDRCERVFVGKVLDRESYMDEKGTILTRYRLSVERTIKGPPSSEVELIEYGGTVGDLTLILTHNAHYFVGRRYLVFAYFEGPDRIRTLAGSLGRLSVVADKDGRDYVSIYPTHPLRTLSQPEFGFFCELGALAGTIQQFAVRTRTSPE